MANAEMMNRKAASFHSQPKRVIESLNLSAGQTILDVGAGGGYFAFKFAEAVGADGRVYAADSDEKMIDYMETYKALLGLDIVEILHTNGGVPNVPDSACDMIFMRNVYHHIDNPLLFFMAISSKLRPSGQLVVIEHTPSAGFSFSSIMGHHTKESDIIETLDQAGYTLLKSHGFLKKQSFNIFALKQEA